MIYCFYDADTALFFSYVVLAIIVQELERSPYAHKFKNLDWSLLNNEFWSGVT